MATSIQQVYDTYDTLRETTTHYADLCPGISKPLVNMLVDRLPQSSALTLSIGCGSGLLEAILLHAADVDHGKQLNLFGVEVPDCAITHLTPDRVLRVPNTMSLHDDAILASTLMFVYPRQAKLIRMYIDAAVDGALEQLIWLGHRSDWAEAELLLLAAFSKIQCIDGPGIAAYELLAIASVPRRGSKQCD